MRRRLLFNGNRGRQSLNQIQIGLFHQIDELAGIGGQAFNVAALPFGIQRIKSQRRLARSRQSGNDDQLIARQIQINVFQIVFARAADPDDVHRFISPFFDSRE